MTQPMHVGLISETRSLKLRETTRVAAALQKAATRDFGPARGVALVVAAFDRLADLPVGFWPILVRDDIATPGAAGVHADDHGQPYALVTAGADWAFTASHELWEMAADPYGNRLVAGTTAAGRRVQFLDEASDPCEGRQYGYTVDGVLVSDFTTPHYFDPAQTTGRRYSFTGALPGPRTVLPGGYLSWLDTATGRWAQLRYFGPQAEVVDLGLLVRSNGSLRAMVDRVTTPVVPVPVPVPADRTPPDPTPHVEAQKARAQRLAIQVKAHCRRQRKGK